MNKKRVFASTLVILPLFVALTTLADSPSDTSRKASPMRDTVKHSELSRSLRMAQQNDPMRNLGPAMGDTEKDPAKNLAGRDLIKESIILCFRGDLTLVPKNSVLYMPPQLESRFQAADGAAIKTWQDFYRANRGWIRTIEVSQDQAMGRAPLPKDTEATFASSTSVIVATYNGGPISVNPYVEPEEPKSDLGASTK